MVQNSGVNKPIKCHHRWQHVVIELNTMKTNTCCKTDVYTADITEDDAFLNSQYQKERRQEMFDGIRYNGCNSCWQVEDNGGISWRMTGDDMSPGGINSVDSDFIWTLELVLDNTCDMKCIYCSHLYSSQWALEDYKTGKITKEEYNKLRQGPTDEFLKYFWNWFDKKKDIIHTIQVKGGEPLITPTFYELVEKVQNTKCNISVVTNLNTPDNYFDLFLENLEKYSVDKNFVITISIDSVEEDVEYIRSGLSWKQFEKNIHKLYKVAQKNPKNIHISYITTMTLLAFKNHHKLLKFIYKLSKDYNKSCQLNFNHPDWPYELNPYNGPRYMAKYLRPSIKFLETLDFDINAHDVDEMKDHWNKYKEAIVNLKNILEKNKYAQPVPYRLNVIDKDRNLDHTKLFPEIYIDKNKN